MIPSAFISHGAPDRILGRSAAKDFIENFSTLIEKPKAILVVSAHWMSRKITLTDTGKHQTIYDFGGFDPVLSQIVYSAEQPEWLTTLVEKCLTNHGENYEIKKRGLDHGAWTILAMAYPAADIPVIGLSLPIYEQMSDYFALGKKLSGLRESGVLILGSGSATHNLGELSFDGITPVWASVFTLALQQAIEQKDYTSLSDIYTSLPHAKHAHPTSEHYLPLLVALGAAENEKTQLIHDSYDFGSLNNSSWLFGD